jgi:hypothetical protein
MGYYKDFFGRADRSTGGRGLPDAHEELWEGLSGIM